MKVCGIIAEYDPFHKGHAYQLEQARRKSGADFMVCVLGCAFSQRGEAMLFSTHDRANMALRNGFDLVLGLPFSFSCAQANRFARGGVGILHRLGCVSHLSFGSESDDLEALQVSARMLQSPGDTFTQSLKEALAKGMSFAAAQGKALQAALPQVDPALFLSPNFILGVSYLKELAMLGSSIQAVPVKRSTPYHSRELSPLASASAVRKALLEGRDLEVQQALPEESLKVIETAPRHLPQALDKALLACLLSLPPETLRGVPEVSEGLEIRIKAAAREAVSRQDLLSLIKTKRYPRTRIARALTQAFIGLKDAPDKPEYARLLGMREGARPLVRAIAEGGFPLIGRPARASIPSLAQDMRSEELWQLGAGKPAAGAWRQNIVMIKS